MAFHAALVEQARAAAAARVVRAYGRAVVAAERASVLADLITGARAQANLVMQRIQQGDAIQRDAALASVEVARQEAMIAETRAMIARALGDLSELVGEDAAVPLGPVEPPSLPPDATAARLSVTPRALSLAAEARLYSASAERWRREGRSMWNVGLLAGRGDYGETRLGGGLAYTFPVFRANRPERAQAVADSARALTARDIELEVASRRLRALRQEQAELFQATAVLTDAALPAARAAVYAARDTYSAGKLEH